MKPNFERMTKAELRTYVLKHRDDLEALRSLMSRRDPKASRYSFPDTPEGLQQIQEVIKSKIQDN